MSQQHSKHNNLQNKHIKELISRMNNNKEYDQINNDIQHLYQIREFLISASFFSSFNSVQDQNQLFQVV